MLNITCQHIVDWLIGYDLIQVQCACGMHGIANLCRRPFRDASIEHFALCHKIIEGTQHFLDRRLIVITMALIQIDIVGIEAAQAGVALFNDMFAREATIIRTIAHRKIHFGCQYKR